MEVSSLLSWLSHVAVWPLAILPVYTQSLYCDLQIALCIKQYVLCGLVLEYCHHKKYSMEENLAVP
jgi:hypothetical protein